MSLPFLSVIVPVRNEGAFIRRTLGQLLAQDYDAERFEILVADGRSTDDTAAVVRALAARHPNLMLLDNPRRWSSAGRNRALLASRGEIILLIDGHCDLDNPRYLRDLADAFTRSGADCVGRPQPLDVSGTTRVQQAIAAARSSPLGHHPASYIYSSAEGFVPPESVAVAYRRSVFEAVGLFDEDFDACEDVEFNHRVARAGLTCFFTPRVGVRYYPRASLAGLFRQMVRYGRGRVRLLRKHPDTWSWSCFVPAAFLLSVVIGAALAWLSPLLAAVYAAGLGTYAAVVLLTSLVLGIKALNLRALPWLPFAFAAIHGGAGAGVLQEMLAGFRPRRAQPGLAPEDHPIVNAASLTLMKPQPAKTAGVRNALTVDVEDYYQVSAFEDGVDRADWDGFESRVVASTQRILDVLDAAGVQGTFFVLGWVADRHPELVRAIHAAGHEIGCHGFWHRLIYRQQPDEFRADLRWARDVLQDITGEPVVAYRAPSFSITQRSLWALDVLIEEGFRFDSSIYPTLHDRYGIAGAPQQPHRIVRPAGAIWEFPMTVYRCLNYPLPIGGGGYFRLYPYWFTRHGLRAVNAAGRPFVFYLHPWELDPDQPRLPAGWLKTFRHHVNQQRTEERLRQLVQDFALGKLSDLVSPGAEHVSLHSEMAAAA